MKPGESGDSMRSSLAVAVVVLAAVGLAVVPRSVEVLTGIRAEPEVAAPDALPALAADDVAPFLAERDRIERVVVAENTTLRQFLDRNRLNRPWTRDQITEQLGNADPAAAIPAGTVFHLRLTPTASDVPGAAVTK
jgi:hypothetical protein